MVLIDGNYFARRFFHSAHAKNEKLEDSLKMFRHLFLYNLINLKVRFAGKYGQLVIAKDWSSWRKEVLPSYKGNRKEKNKDPEILEFFKVYEDLASFLMDNTNIKVLSSINVEADDIIYVLSKTPGKHLVYSSDKDLIQCLNDDVDVFDFNNDRFIQKSKDVVAKFMVHHILIGDNTDNIPNITWNSNYTKEFEKWIKNKYNIDMSIKILYKFIREESLFFEEYREETKLKPFKGIRMGKKTADKLIEADGVNELINSNPIIKRNYKINEFLIDMSNIPEPIKETILNLFYNYKIKIPNFNMLYRYCDLHDLSKVKERINKLIN